MRVITSLQELISELDQSSKSEYAAIGARLDIPISELAAFSHWSPDHYTRNCIKRTDHYELILLCWEPGQGTPIHCHGGEECWVYMTDGTLAETHYQLIDSNLIEESSESMVKGQKSFMCDDFGYHALKNISPTRSMSLHLYMDPIDSCTRFDEGHKEFKPVDLVYFSFEGNLVETTV